MVTVTTETAVTAPSASNSKRSLSGKHNGTRDSGYQLGPYQRFQHQAVDWLGLMHRKHTAHLLMEVDVTEARRAIAKYQAGVGAGSTEPESLTAFVTACLAKAIEENKQMHAYHKGR